ncbi:MAG TPA: polysaccharide biosynthesis/export family protein, partial [Beijerinckiaceae bacterium]
MTSTALRSATALAACILCAAGDASLAQSSTALREAQTVAPSAALRIGDRVKIGFFDSVDLGAGRADANPAAPPGLRAFYQRVDLTSEQAVDSDGGLRIPRLGAFVAAGKDVAALELEIAQAYRNETGRETQVQVSLVERAPVYVMGYVRAPGAQRYAPGLLAIHAVALAGGVERSRDSLPEMREARRERERQAQAEERLKRLLARHARLTAQQAGSRNV